MAKDWTQDETIKQLELLLAEQDAEIERLRNELKNPVCDCVYLDDLNKKDDEVERLREELIHRKAMWQTEMNAATGFYKEIERLRSIFEKLVEKSYPSNDYIKTGVWVFRIEEKDIFEITGTHPKKPRFGDVVSQPLSEYGKIRGEVVPIERWIDAEEKIKQQAKEIERLRAALGQISFRVNNLPKGMELTPESPLFGLIKTQVMIALQQKETE